MATRKGIKLYFAGVMCFVAALTVLTVPVLGQDAGAPDSIKLVLSVAPVEGTNVPVVVECSVFVDSNQLSILQFGWYWDNVNLQMDSAIASSAFEAMEIGPFFFIYNDLQTTNDSQIAAASGTAIFTLFPTSSSWQHLCTYYMTASTWTDSSSLQIDTIQHPDITGTDNFFLPVGGTDYDPIWGGPIFNCICPPTPIDIILNPTELHFVASQGGTLPVTQNFIISNSNFSQTLDWSLTYDSLWLSVSPQSGSVGVGSQEITVSILTTNKPPDSYYENIVVESPQADNSPQIVNVEYVVTSPCCIGTRGDLNGDGDDANILDLTFAVDRIFRGGGPSACPEEGDVNGDGNPHNILDLTFLVDRIFRGGPPPGPC